MEDTRRLDVWSVRQQVGRGRIMQPEGEFVYDCIYSQLSMKVQYVVSISG